MLSIICKHKHTLNDTLLGSKTRILLQHKKKKKKKKSKKILLQCKKKKKKMMMMTSRLLLSRTLPGPMICQNSISRK